MEILNSNIDYLDCLSLLVCLKKNVFNKYVRKIKQFVTENQGFKRQQIVFKCGRYHCSSVDAIINLEMNVKYYIDNIHGREHLFDTKKKNFKKDIFFSIIKQDTDNRTISIENLEKKIKCHNTINSDTINCDNISLHSLKKKIPYSICYIKRIKHMVDDPATLIDDFYATTEILKHVLIQHFERLKYKMLNSVMHVDNECAHGYDCEYVRNGNKYYKITKAQLFKKINFNDLIALKDIVNSFKIKYTRLTEKVKKLLHPYIILMLDNVASYIKYFCPVYPIMKSIYDSIIQILLFCANTQKKEQISDSLFDLLFQNINFSLNDILSLNKYYFLDRIYYCTNTLSDYNYYLFKSVCLTNISSHIMYKISFYNLCNIPPFIVEILITMISKNFGLLANSIFLQNITKIITIIYSKYEDCRCFTNTNVNLISKKILNKYMKIIKVYHSRTRESYRLFRSIDLFKAYIKDYYKAYDIYSSLLDEIEPVRYYYGTNKSIKYMPSRCSYLRQYFLKTKCNMCTIKECGSCEMTFCSCTHTRYVTHETRRCTFKRMYSWWFGYNDDYWDAYWDAYSDNCYCYDDCNLFFENVQKKENFDNYINLQKNYNMKYKEIMNKRKFYKKVRKYIKNTKTVTWSKSENLNIWIPKEETILIYDKVKNYGTKIINSRKCPSITNVHKPTNHKKSKRNLVKQINRDISDYYSNDIFY